MEYPLTIYMALRPGHVKLTPNRTDVPLGSVAYPTTLSYHQANALAEMLPKAGIEVDSDIDGLRNRVVPSPK